MVFCSLCWFVVDGSEKKRVNDNNRERLEAKLETGLSPTAATAMMLSRQSFSGRVGSLIVSMFFDSEYLEFANDSAGAEWKKEVVAVDFLENPEAVFKCTSSSFSLSFGRSLLRAAQRYRVG
jgi:hypothetical protein